MHFPPRGVHVAANCCVSCFDNRFLREYIQEHSTHTGTCDYCGSRRRRLLPVGELADFFHNLVSMYEPSESESGSSLISLVRDGWTVFSDRLCCDGEKADELLEDILNSDWDDDSGEGPFRVHELYEEIDSLPEVENWDAFCEEVLEDPDAEPEFSDFFDEELGAAEEKFADKTVLYRARAGWAAAGGGPGGPRLGPRIPYRGAEIGAPPPELATAGRANRQGKSVLYCAEDEHTAVAEVRPALGFYVSTCQIRLRRELRVLDLKDGIRIPNPFIEDSLAWRVAFAGLLHSFAEALSTPLSRSDDFDVYLPSQKLCEHLERLGYDGVRYPSAMHEGGSNLVLFDPGVAEILESRLVEVTSATIRYHPRP